MTEQARERRPRRSFSKEYKAEVVALVRTSGKTIAAIARDMDLGETAVREWVRGAHAAAAANTCAVACRIWRCDCA